MLKQRPKWLGLRTTFQFKALNKSKVQKQLYIIANYLVNRVFVSKAAAIKGRDYLINDYHQE